MLHAPSAILRVSLLVLASAAALGQETRLSQREGKALVEEYLALDARGAEDRERCDEILARLEAHGELSAREAARWRKTVLALAAKGPRLEEDRGEHFLWEDEQRGMYIVDGETRRPQGLFIGLHGGSDGSGEARWCQRSFSDAVAREDWLAIYPQVLERVSVGWTKSGTEEFVMELVERALRTWKIDRDRVFLGGHSMGGFGTWSLGSHHADRFAALAVSCGAPTSAWSSSSDPGDEVDGMIPNLRNLPIVFYHGADDRRVAPDASRRAAGRMAAARERWGAFDFEYWEEAGRGHSGPPGGMGALLERIADREREARPERLVWQPALDWKQQFYWLWSERPGSPGLVEAELDQESGILRIDSDAPAGLRVLLDDDLLDLEGGLTLILNGGEPRAVLPLRNLAIIARTGRGGDDALTFEAAVVVSP